MKTYKIFRAIKTLALGVAAVSLLNSCALEERTELPEEELYLRNFIKKYGLISPDQDWNTAQSGAVAVETKGHADLIEVYVKVGSKYYIVAQYTDVTGRVNIPVDVPEGITDLLVVIDDDVYYTHLGGIVRQGEPSRAQSRASDDYFHRLDDPLPLKWILAGEDLGDSDDFDFNDVVLQISCATVNHSLTTSVANENWQAINNDEAAVLHAPSRAGDEESKELVITALAAGGTLPLYLHYNDGTTDVILGPTDATSDDAKEWHNWFRHSGSLSGIGYESSTMINTGAYTVTAASTESITINVPTSFTMDHYSYVEYDGGAGGEYYWNPEPGKIYGFYFTVDGKNMADCANSLTATIPGSAPKMFLIPDVAADLFPGAAGWLWPTERTAINTVYDGFKDWVSNPTSQWYLNPKAGNKNAIYQKR